MKNSCVFVPSKGKDTFRQLKKNFGYETAAKVFNKITGTDFLKIYGDKISVDSEGIPTYESIMNLPAVKNFVGLEARINSAQRQFTPVEDTMNNASALID